jgi:DNA-binding NarL/FixJ family response regulator
MPRQQTARPLNSEAGQACFLRNTGEVFDHLSAREFDVPRLLSTGAPNGEIAAALGVKEGTVRNAIARLTRKLGVADRTQAALLGYKAGLASHTAVSPPPSRLFGAAEP